MIGRILSSRRMRAVVPPLGLLFVFVGAAMLIPLAIALYEGGSDRLALGLSAAVAVLVGFGLLAPYAERKAEVRPRDAILVIAIAWLGVGALGGLPYVFSGTLGPVDAVFESVSGLTTTGASVIAAPEDLPAGLLFWRSLTHWIGGMGILVLAVVLLPMLGTASYSLLRTEAPSLEHERLFPRIAQTARALFGVYALFTGVESALLMLGGMSLFDALTHAFGTIATGGFSTRNASVGAYGSAYVEAVVLVFMFLGSLPFGVHLRGLRRPRAYLESTQVRVHAAILTAACLAVVLELWGHGVYAGLLDAARYGTFQVTSLLTTTGFATADSEKWTPFAHVVLVSVMFFGGCTGSTSGAIKTFRFIVLGKLAAREIFVRLHPRAVRQVRIDGEVIESRVIQSAGAYFVLYLVVAWVGTMGLMATGSDGMTALSATAATLGGVGPGLGDVGPYDNYGWMPDAAKAICIGLMLLGRLEILTFTLVFLPGYWREG